ncbi:MAG: hypothetical protein AAFR81_21550 [Chloroflexota bacterium]
MEVYEDLQAIDCAWDVPKSQHPIFWSQFQQTIGQQLRTLYQAGKVRLVLPFRHRRMAFPDQPDATWSVYILLLVPSAVDVSALVNELFHQDYLQPLQTSGTLRCVNRARTQPEVNMVYPIRHGVKGESRLIQTIEYVASQPEQRQDYYQSQYEFSGPAMRRLYQRDRVGRFMGIEIVERLIDSPNTPVWDVIHISGFTPWQAMRAVPHFWRAFQQSAAQLGGSSAWERMQKWSSQRVKVQTRSQQQLQLTLPDATQIES